MTSRWRRARMAVAAGALGSLLIGGAAAMAAPGGNGWNSAGGDRQNTRYAANESKISPATVGGLTKKWELTTGGDVSRFQRRSVPSQSRSQSEQAAGNNVAAASPVAAVPQGPSVKVARGNSVTVVPVGAR